MPDSTPSDPTRSEPGRIDDETLSAHLDGELSAEDRAALTAALEGDPESAARLETLRAAAELTATPVPSLDAARVDELITNAIAAGTTAANVTDLGRVGRRPRTLPRLAVAAAVVVIVALAIPLLRSLDDDTDADETADAGDQTTAELSLADDGEADAVGEGADDAAADAGGDAGADDTADDAGETAATEAFDAADEGAAADVERVPGDGAATEHGGLLPPALGEFADVDGLQAAVEAAIGRAGGVGGDTAAGAVEDDPSAETPPSTTAPDAGAITIACLETVTERARALGAPADDQAPVQLAEAVLSGDPVVVALIDADADVPGLVIVRAADCTLVVERMLD